MLLRDAAIRDWMPDHHREPFAGWPAATILNGPLGFLASPDPKTMRTAALPDHDNLASRWFKTGAVIGLLGIRASATVRTAQSPPLS